MTKRFSQANTVVVPAVHAVGVDGKVAAAKSVVVPADAEVASAETAVKADDAPVIEFVEPVAAVVAPTPMAMVAGQTSTDTTTSTTATTTEDDGSTGDSDMTPYIVGGVLVVGGVLAIALSSGDDTPAAPPPPPPPPPPPATTVAISSAATATVAENVTTTGTTGPVVLDVNAAATATNGGTPGAVTYALSGADAAAFTINTTTGEIRLNSSANFEAKSTYAITVTASSAANGTTPAATATQNITVTVTNVNEAPAFAATTATATVVENTAAGVVYTPVAAVDPDANTTLTYALGGADAAAFTINAATGAVSLRAPADFETKATYTFTVTASDNATPALSSAAQTVTLNVTNVNEAPAFAAATRTVSVAENTTAVIAAGGATDPDAGATVTYSLGAGGDAALFNVNATTGAVTFKAAPDFEAVPTKNTYTFNLVANDGTNSTTQAVTVNVTDVVNEGPPPATVSLDAAGPFSGLGAGGTAQATTFTDNTTVASNATVNNFGADDIVSFSGTTTVSFSSIDNDLLVEFVNAGVLNKIQINDIVSPNAIITSESSAEAAVNAFFGTTGVDYFRFA